MCWSIPLIDTWSTLDRPLIHTQSTFQFTIRQESTNFGLMDWFHGLVPHTGLTSCTFPPWTEMPKKITMITMMMHVTQLDTRCTFDRLLIKRRVSTEYQLGCRSSVNQDFNWVSIYTGRLRVLIDTRLQMHLANMIYFSPIYSVDNLWRKSKTNLNCQTVHSVCSVLFTTSFTK